MDMSFAEIKTDVKLLLECLELQNNDAASVKQTLMTLSSILQGSGNETQDIFRDAGGIQQLLELVTSTRHHEVTEAGLYCLGSAVEKNVYSQKLLSTASLFTFLHGVFGSTNASTKKKQTASYLLLCIVSNNGYGQNLARQSLCLHDIMSLIRSCHLPKQVSSGADDWLESVDGDSIDLWAALVSAACACVNNPVNDENQRICSSLLPFVFSVMSRHTDERILKPVLSLVGLTVANNAQNQDRVRQCGGLEIFVKKLASLADRGIESVETSGLAVQLMSTLDICITDNSDSCQKFGSLGGVQLVMKLLSSGCLQEADRIQAVLTLASAVDSSETNKKFITADGGLAVLIQQLTVTENEELSRTVKYLLHLCVTSEKSGREDLEDDSDVTRLETLMTKMEKMKKYTDLDMLKKIRELDNKLKCMEKEAAERQRLHDVVEDGHWEKDLCTSQLEKEITHDTLESVAHQMLGGIPGVYIKDQFQKKTRNKANDLPACHQPHVTSPDAGPGQRLKHQPSPSCSVHCHKKCSTICNNQRLPQTKANIASSVEEKQVSNLCSSLRSTNTPCEHVPSECNISDSCRNEECKQPQYIAFPLEFLRNDLRNHTQQPAKEVFSETSSSGKEIVIKNAEVQCGTPFVFKTGNQNAASDENALIKPNSQCVVKRGTRQLNYMQTVDNSSEKQVVNSDARGSSAEPTRAQSVKNRNFNSNCDTSSKADQEAGVLQRVNQDLNSNAVVVLEDIGFSLKSSEQSRCKPSTFAASSSANQNRIGSGNAKSAGNFVKPLAPPPKKKVRQTPLLGLNKIQELGVKLPHRGTDKDLNDADWQDDVSEVQSEFDLQLTRKTNTDSSKRHTFINSNSPSKKMHKKEIGVPRKAAYVIKSQNNVWRIDRQLEARDDNPAEKWSECPRTPLHQAIIPVRPAFSDCGTRRLILDSPYSVMSVGKLTGQELHDSGIHSPIGKKQSSASSSPVDSNIDECRSSSDLSDTDDGPPNITRAVLRSGNKCRKFERQALCPGCQCPFKTGGPLLNSRTYNKELETNPYTCQFHRRLRQCERLHIQKQRRKMVKRNKVVAEKLQVWRLRDRNNHSSKRSVYEFSAESSQDDLSPYQVEEDMLIMRGEPRKRRKRLPYTLEEEENLKEGVLRMGKFWNQILMSYNFHPSRTNIDLKDKYKRMMHNEQREVSTVASRSTLRHRPFSICEERRLCRGVKLYGCSWKKILQSFKFSEGRTAENLRNRWRVLKKNRLA